MIFLTDTDDIDIDMYDIIMKVDDIMHQEITNKTGITVSHHKIQGFVADIIRENNQKQLQLRRERQELSNDIKKFDNMYDKKLKNGKIVKDLKGIKNIVKYYIFNYILIYPTGCGTENHVTQCAECIHTYGSDECKEIRKESGFLLAWMNQKFI